MQLKGHFLETIEVISLGAPKPPFVLERKHRYRIRKTLGCLIQREGEGKTEREGRGQERERFLCTCAELPLFAEKVRERDRNFSALVGNFHALQVHFITTF